MKNIPYLSNSKNKALIFDNNLKEEKKNSTRVIVVLATLLYIVHSIMDYFGLPKDALIVLFTSKLVNLIAFGTIFALTFKDYFQQYYNKILVSGYLISGFTICIAIFISQKNEYSFNLYFASFLVLMFTSFTWSYLPIKHTLSMSACFIAAYILIKIYIQKMTISDVGSIEFFVLTSHIFFLIAVVFVASIAQFIKDNLIYKNIKLQDELETIVAAKTEEAKEHAKLANLDALTGLPNRRSMQSCMHKMLIEARQANTQLTLIFIDLNGFKKINDTYGHDSGDKVLEITAKRLLQTIRKEDYVARLGGDEFVICIKTNCFTGQFVKTLCKKIRTSISAHIAFNGCKLHVGTSIGIASYPEDGDDIEELVKVADRRMYIDKQQIKKEMPPALSESLI